MSATPLVSTPTVGRFVHYVSYGTPNAEYPSTCRASVITEVCDNPDGIDPETGTQCVGLAVFNPTGMFFNRHIPADQDGKKPGTWHWPDRV
jgi:hypothetical protein